MLCASGLRFQFYSLTEKPLMTFMKIAANHNISQNSKRGTFQGQRQGYKIDLNIEYLRRYMSNVNIKICTSLRSKEREIAQQ